MEANLLAGRAWTEEQLRAITRRQGDLLLDAAAGSGKTSVLVERFVESVLRDGLEVPSILTITFTEKAAAEMRDRIRARLRELGATQAARETEGAFISTIHGFCARLLRSNALAAGIDPHYRVLDGWEAQRLADLAFDDALEDVGREEGGMLELIAAYGPGGLRAAVLATHGELRSRGEIEPRLPPLGPAPDLEGTRGRLQEAAAGASAELGALDSPAARVLEALARLEGCSELLVTEEPWPGELARLALPGGNGTALSTSACTEYVSALEGFRAACEYRWAARAHRLLDLLLRSFGARYARRKREASGLDFADLELFALSLVRREEELRERLRDRFARIMVDELQDTNRVQLELIEHLACENLFTVGDAQQSIYGFRHADVQLFEDRGRRLEATGDRITLQTNFRSRPEILRSVNRVFEHELGAGFRRLDAGRQETGEDRPRVELLVADKGADWDYEGLASPWRVAEARALADRLADLMAEGVAPRDVVVLLRAATDMRVYERALEERGIPTYVIGGRGYWNHPQVLDLVAYLRALANPRDAEALYTVLASPLVGVSLDTLVVLAAAGRAADRDPWWVVSQPEGRLDELKDSQRPLLERFTGWFSLERRSSARLGVEQLIERALELTGYDEAVLAMPGGTRRLANVRKLMRLAGENAAMAGDPLRRFLELVRFRSAAWSAGERSESEAPVEGEALDAVRLMTIHRAKGLEFDVVCVADLGRGPRGRSELMRIGPDGRFGLRLAQPGTGRNEPALEYRALGETQQEADAAEERRLFYVAMTRARERLILSGAAKLAAWPPGGGGGPMGWIGPALIDDLPERALRREGGVADGVEIRFVDSDSAVPAMVAEPARAIGPATQTTSEAAWAVLRDPLPPPPPAAPASGVSEISYSALEEHRRCAYRFYVERVLGLPALDVEVAGGEPGRSGFSGIERGLLVHALLERLDFRRPLLPDAEAIRRAAGRALAPRELEEVRGLLEAFSNSPLCARLGRATGVRTEQRFLFLLGSSPGAGGILMRGVLDVIAHEPGARALVVDYKTDRLEDTSPEAVVRSAYATQRLAYGLAALRAGASEVEVIHIFLEQPEAPPTAVFSQNDVPGLEGELEGFVTEMVAGRFPVTPAPHRTVCQGCPAEGGLCSWPLTATRRSSPDQLF